VHILQQPALRRGDGPIALVLAPTRELVAQIHGEARKFCKSLDISVWAIFGGEGK
jgi:superfamily II DNA/RNA helicase